MSGLTAEAVDNACNVIYQFMDKLRQGKTINLGKHFPLKEIVDFGNSVRAISAHLYTDDAPNGKMIEKHAQVIGSFAERVRLQEEFNILQEVTYMDVMQFALAMVRLSNYVSSGCTGKLAEEDPEVEEPLENLVAPAPEEPEYI